MATTSPNRPPLTSKSPAVLTASYLNSGHSNQVNPYRVKYFIDDMTDEEFTAITVAGIATLKAMGKL